MAVVIFLAAALGSTACGFVTNPYEVTRVYATRQDAEADILFSRGWLPDIIPSSSRMIVTHNNLDRDTSWGQLSFDTKDLDSFLAHLTPAAGMAPQIEGSELLGKLQSEGNITRAVYEFSNRRCTWVFLIHPTQGHAYYYMWSH